MNQGLLQRAEGVFLELVEVPREERAALLDRLCGGDQNLRDEVKSILEHHDGTAGTDAFLRTGDMHRAFDAGPLLPSTRIGEFTVLGVLGAGGMGVVYRAQQERPRRTVALKLMRQAPLPSGSIQRFEHEAELLGRLQHPGIAQIFGAGVANIGFGAQPYFAMELVDGPSIAEYASTHRLGTRERLELVLKVCAAAEHAHTKGVIHRDLKPANILVGHDGEPKIVDFGIARAAGSDIEAMNTRAGELLGTLAYMSPEQVSGDPSDVDTRTDVYALGVVLYQLLCGRPARDVGSIPLEQALQKIREEDPPLLGTLDRSFKGDLETIAARAMSRDRDRRYQSAAALAGEVRRYLAGEPIEARRDSAIYVFRRRLHRYRALVAAACAVVIGLAAFAVYAWNESMHQAALVVQASDARTQAQAALDRATRDAEAVRHSDYFNRIGFAQAAYAGGDSDRMMRLLDACPVDLRGWEWSYLRQFGDRSTAVLTCREAGHGSAALASLAGRIVTFRLGEQVDIWDVRTRQKLRSIQPEGKTSGISITPDGKLLATTTTECVQLWDEAGSQVWRKNILPRPGGVDISADGRHIALIGPSEHVRILDGASGEQVADFACRGNVVCGKFTPDGTRLVCGDTLGVLSLFSADSGTLLATADGRSGLILSLGFSGDGKVLSTGGEDGTDRQWNIGAQGISGRSFYRMHSNKVTATAISPSGRLLVTGSTDTTMKVVDLVRGEELGTLTGHTRTIACVAFINEEELISASQDGTLRWWTVRDLGDALAAKAEGNPRHAVYGFDGRIVVTGEPGKLQSFDAKTLSSMPMLGSSPDPIYSLCGLDDTLISADHGGAIRTWRHGGESTVIARHKGPARDAAPCKARHWIASVGIDGDLMVNDIDNGGLIQRLAAHVGGATAVACTQSGDRIVTAGNDCRVRVWDTATWTQRAELSGHTEGIWCILITRDGKTIATSGDDGNVFLWPMDGGPRRRLEGHHGAVYCIAESADGARLITGGFDNTVRLWDEATGSELLTLRGHTSSVWSVAFSPTGDSILSCSDNGTIRLWQAKPARTAAGR